ncbi:helix-turn-helix domain-containing protein [Chryseobacterium sp.]|uniref:helix-turn-helix domain-containing protein n=1 Tax=Chryseobacterium sp. TaxID=1871047 RepID=UPI0026385969|nr:helix-turn-helix domain-containing protein [Chryseobacterium sp.]
MEKYSQPNYHRIYSDIIIRSFPHKKEECEKLLRKKYLSVIDILELNKKIFGAKAKETSKQNQKHRSYNKSDIIQILDYQKTHKMNNSQVAKHFGLSKNSMTKWRKIFL